MARSLLTTGAELPPRTRRIHFLYLTHYRVFGTTSAHAENTSRPGNIRPPPRNYLRARGEYLSASTPTSGLPELPPRTRRIRTGPASRGRAHGTTSAHAENTPRPRQTATRTGNYLRARGEYAYAHLPGPLEKELPPRTRRIHLGGDAVGQKTGTTSAHAENTLLPGRQAGRNRNYLRARGEYKSPRGSGRRLRELPPRTRRIPHSNPPSVSVSGTTSAHAENTFRR